MRGEAKQPGPKGLDKAAARTSVPDLDSRPLWLPRRAGVFGQTPGRGS